MDPNAKDYVIVVQCDIAMQRCSGYACEKAFTDRTGGFADYPRDRSYRTLYLTCSGCCGQAVQRKLTHAARKLRAEEDIGKDRIVVQLATCITRDNYHGPPCPHLDYLKTLIDRVGLEYGQDTHICKASQARRQAGTYPGSP